LVAAIWFFFFLKNIKFNERVFLVILILVSLAASNELVFVSAGSPGHH
jgi:hypothetical protein